MADVEMPFSVSLTQKDELHVESGALASFFFFFPPVFGKCIFRPQLSFSSRSRTGWSAGCLGGRKDGERGGR